MENDSISSSSSESKLPLIVGIVGFALGAAGLVLGIKAKGEAANANLAAVAAQQAASEVGAALAGKASAADLQAVAADLGAIKQGVDANNKTFGDAIAALQAAAKKPAAVASEKGGKASAAAGPGEYVVVKGDNLGSIAKKAGLSLKALQDLNPNAKATQLQIGQRLKTK
jgi:LysM repeat protein